MIPFLGRSPENPNWHTEPAYNGKLATLLKNVYGEIADEAHRPTPEHMEQARKRLPVVCGAAPAMSAHQRFALASLRCQLALGGASGESAEDALQSARLLAEDLDDPLALAEGDFLAGWCCQGKMDYVGASNYFTLAAERLKRERETCPQAGDTTLELRALSGLAVHRFLLADYTEAERCVEEGLELSRGVPETQSQRALLLWTRALLQRWRGHLEDALTCAFNSADLLERDAKNASFGRIQAVAGEIAFDLAERYCAERPAHGRTVWLAIGRARIAEAARIADSVNDGPGRGMALLGQVRYKRMSLVPEEQGTPEERLEEIEQAKSFAPGDLTLACQAETARGHEYDACGKHEEALDSYRKAMDLVNGHHDGTTENIGEGSSPRSSLAQAFLVWPRREILKSREMLE